MTQAQHTPGPWSAKRRDSGWDITAKGREGYGREIAVVLSRGDDVQSVNARLIAAAPDLLAALERSLNWLASYPGEGTLGVDGPYDQARAAIKSARGEQ